MRKERSYVNKLNLALVQVCGSIPTSIRNLNVYNNNVIDSEARMATQLAHIYSGACRIIKDKPHTLREQHGHPQAPL